MESLAQIETEEPIINLKKRIFTAWEKSHTKRTRTNLHVSDLSTCLRQACFRHLDEKPPEFTEQSTKSLLVGEATHRYIQSLLGSEEFYHEKEVIWTSKTGIRLIAHPDIIERKTGVVIELKTSTSTAIFRAPFNSHLKQLRTYCAITGARAGVLLYIILGKEGSPDKEFFKEYHLKISDRERSLILEKLEQDITELSRGFKLGPESVRHIYNDKEYKNRYTGRNWLCDGGYCPYADKCAVMRAQEDKNAQQKKGKSIKA
jgi:hypothetical protein